MTKKKKKERYILVELKDVLLPNPFLKKAMGNAWPSIFSKRYDFWDTEYMVGASWICLNTGYSGEIKKNRKKGFNLLNIKLFLFFFSKKKMIYFKIYFWSNPPIILFLLHILHFYDIIIIIIIVYQEGLV